jgi:hypothetical protein
MFNRRDRLVGIPLQQLATQIFLASGTAGLISVECDPDSNFHGYTYLAVRLMTD